MAHFHIVLSLGAIYGILGGYYYWSPKILGNGYDARLSYIGFWLLTIGALTTFTPMHNLGLDGMPRRYRDYTGFDTYETWHFIASFGSTINIIALAIILSIIIAQVSETGGKVDMDMWSRSKYFNRCVVKSNYSLEFMLSSPVKYHSYEEIPVVIEEYVDEE